MPFLQEKSPISYVFRGQQYEDFESISSFLHLLIMGLDKGLKTDSLKSSLILENNKGNILEALVFANESYYISHGVHAKYLIAQIMLT